jgi:hypothetical protein
MTPNAMIEATKILSGLPKGLRDSLFRTFQEIAANFAEHRWEPSELNGGKFCEVVYTIIHGALSNAFPAKPSKPKDMRAACLVCLSRCTRPDLSNTTVRADELVFLRWAQAKLSED